MSVNRNIDCLILYNSQVKPELLIAEELVSYLKSNDIDAKIISGDNPSLNNVEIDEAILLIVIYSKQTNNSEKVKSCLNAAFNAKKVIIPFVLDTSPMDDELYYYLNRKHWIVSNSNVEDSLIQLLSAIRVVLGRAQSYSITSVFVKLFPIEDTYVFINQDNKGIARAHQWFSIPVIRDVEYNISLKAVEAPLLSIDYHNIKIHDEDIVLNSDFSYHRQLLIESIEERQAFLKDARVLQSESDGYRRFEILGKWGFVNKYCQSLTEDRLFKDCYDFKHGYATIMENDYEGLIDIFGRVIIPPTKYKRVCLSYENFIIVRDDNYKAGAINIEGETLLKCKYDHIWYNENNYFFFVCLNNIYGTVNKDGVEFWDNEYGNYSCVNGSKFLLFIRNNEIDILNENGEILHTIKECNAIESQYKGVISFKRNNMWGLYNLNKQTEILPAIYRCILPFSEDMAAIVNSSNKVGFVDINGNIIMDCIYDNPHSELETSRMLHVLKKEELFTFKNGLCKVSFPGSNSDRYINVKGEICL